MTANVTPMPANGWHEAKTQGRRARTYRVYFIGGEAWAVDAQVVRGVGNAPYWRNTWHRKDGAPTIVASCAIRAAIAKATGA